MRRVHIKLITMLSVVTFLGCGNYHGASVEGEVTLDGQPISDSAVGTVAFFPDAGGPPATGRIVYGSRYELSTGREDSLIPGEYSVTVGINEAPSSLTGKNGAPPPPGKPITPSRYRQKRTSGLQFTVEPGSNTIDLELQSKG